MTAVREAVWAAQVVFLHFQLERKVPTAQCPTSGTPCSRTLLTDHCSISSPCFSFTLLAQIAVTADWKHCTTQHLTVLTKEGNSHDRLFKPSAEQYILSSLPSSTARHWFAKSNEASYLRLFVAAFRSIQFGYFSFPVLPCSIYTWVSLSTLHNRTVGTVCAFSQRGLECPGCSHTFKHYSISVKLKVRSAHIFA